MTLHSLNVVIRAAILLKSRIISGSLSSIQIPEITAYLVSLNGSSHVKINREFCSAQVDWLGSYFDLGKVVKIAKKNKLTPHGQAIGHFENNSIS